MKRTLEYDVEPTTTSATNNLLSLADLPDDILKLIINSIPTAYKMLIQITCHKMTKFLIPFIPMDNRTLSLVGFGRSWGNTEKNINVLSESLIEAGDLVLFKKQKGEGRANGISPRYLSKAAKYGQLEFLSFLCKNAFGVWSLGFGNWKSLQKLMTAGAAKNGHIHILKWLKSRSWLVKISGRSILKNGHLTTFHWMYEKKKIKGKCFGSGELCTLAAKWSDLAFLKWLMDQGDVLSEGALRAVGKTGNVALLETLFGLMEHATLFNNDDDYSEVALEYGTSQILENLTAQRIFRPTETKRSKHWLSIVVRGGRLENLIWLLQKGCDADYVKIIKRAIRHNHFHLVTWVLESLGGPKGTTNITKLFDAPTQAKFGSRLVKYGTIQMAELFETHGFSWQDRKIAHSTVPIEIDYIIKVDILIFACERGAITDETALFRSALHLGAKANFGFLKWGAQTKRPTFTKMIEYCRQYKEIYHNEHGAYRDSLKTLKDSFGICI